MLGIMAGKGMIPDSLKLKNIVAGLPGLSSSVQNPPAAEHPEDVELDNPKFEFFENLTGAPAAPNQNKEPVSRYTVQLASFEEPEHAAALIKRLKKHGISGESHRVHSANGTWFVVRSGEFDSLSEAERFALEITRRLKYKPLVTRLPE